MWEVHVLLVSAKKKASPKTICGTIRHSLKQCRVLQSKEICKPLSRLCWWQ